MFSFGFGLQHNTICLQRPLAMLLQLKEWCVEYFTHTHTDTQSHYIHRLTYNTNRLKYIGAWCTVICIIYSFIQRASEASEADSQSCSIEISDIYRYVCVRQKISPALLIT